MYSGLEGLPAALRRDLVSRGVRRATDAVQLGREGVLGREASRLVLELERDLEPSRLLAIREHRGELRSMGVAWSASGVGSAAMSGGSHVARSLDFIGAEKCGLVHRLVEIVGPVLPQAFTLEGYESPVRSQGGVGSCVGFATSAAVEGVRRFGPRLGPTFSPRFIYEEAKRIDGIDGEGTRQCFAYEVLVRVGAVPERCFPYSDQVGRLRTTHLHGSAARHRIRGFLDLKLDASMASLQPVLIMAALAGFLGEGPRPVSVSLAVTHTWRLFSAEAEGWIMLPPPGSPILGGHALLIVGYYWDESIQQTVFLLKNSWSGAWASQSPIRAGHALIPAAYFASPELTWELFTPIGEASPVSPLGLLGSIARKAWDPRMFA